MKRYVISHSTIIKNKIDIISNHDEVLDFHEGLARVCFNDKWGYINKEGKEVVKPIYDHALDFHEGLAAVCLNGKWGVIDKEGNQIIDCTFNSINISDGMIIFDKKYMVNIKTMKLLYSFKLSLGNKTVEKSFDDKNKRDRYIKEINEYLKEKNNEVDILKKQLEEQIKKIENSYVDDALEMVNSYYKKYQ